jgi:hypothetical protein
MTGNRNLEDQQGDQKVRWENHIKGDLRIMNINICTKWIQSRVTGRPKLSNSEVVAPDGEEEEWNLDRWAAF